MTELGLLKPDQQFAEIRVYESNQCVNAILPLDEQYKRQDNERNIAHKLKKAKILNFSYTI